MLSKIRRALLWTKIMSRSRAGLISSALDGVRRLEERYALKPYEEAVKYSLALRAGELVVVEKHLKDFVDKYALTSDANTRYAVLYCQYILYGISGDLDEKRSVKTKALEVECDTGVKRWLPL